MTAIDAVAELKIRWNCARPRGRDVRKMDKPWTCREVLFTCSNGWTIETLIKEDYALEGFFMGHCLGTSDQGLCTAVASLREPDGTPHCTFIGYGTEPHGRCNAFPVKYLALINEWREHLKLVPFKDGNSYDAGEAVLWGLDDDNDYHDKGILTDKDYRDMDQGHWWRDEAWEVKRGIRES